MYRGDSFFTLGPFEAAGLLLVSGLLALALLALAARAFRGRRIATRVLIALGLFWLFAWLSPQAYYAYYQTIIPGLPWQVVVGVPPAPGTAVRLLGFAGPATLSGHGLGLLGWALIAGALCPRLLARLI